MIKMKTDEIIKVLEGLSQEVVRHEWKKTSTFYHYTSLPKLYNILDHDSIWASNIRFSNDSTEEKMLNDDQHDDYVICFCEKGDQLSQWRGYCNEGGVAIGFHIGNYQEYSVLAADYDKSSEYIVYKNAPLPVLYVEPQISHSDYSNSELNACIEWMKEKNIDSFNISPYIKNALFYEERESRLAFMNTSEQLSRYIRFRELENGTKVPYIVIKSGDVNQMKVNCSTNPDTYTDDKLLEMYKKLESVEIKEGQDQEKIYYEIEKKVKGFAQNNNHEDLINIYCQGHLLIDEIIVAPTADRSRIAEQIQRFCRSKYWLRNVKVKESQIPFVK